jgi:hypothetical protein
MWFRVIGYLGTNISEEIAASFFKVRENVKYHRAEEAGRNSFKLTLLS